MANRFFAVTKVNAMKYCNDHQQIKYIKETDIKLSFQM